MYMNNNTRNSLYHNDFHIGLITIRDIVGIFLDYELANLREFKSRNGSNFQPDNLTQ